MLGYEAVVGSGPVIFVKTVKFYNLRQLRGILRIGGIATLLQSACPTAVVGALQTEEACIARLRGKKTAMVLVTLAGIVVGTEAFACSVVVVISALASPSVALYAEMVVALTRKVAPSSRTLKQALRKRDACRNVVA